VILIYVTCKDLEESKKISKRLLEKKLVACANFFPINSMYLWKGSINDDNECALILKTVEKKFNQIEEEIKKIHSYECPCIISIKIGKANKKYLEWIKKEMKG